MPPQTRTGGMYIIRPLLALSVLGVLALGFHVLLLRPDKVAIMIDSRKSTTPTQNITIQTKTIQEEQDRRQVFNIFKEAGINLTDDMKAGLPTLSQVHTVVGKQPYIVGLDSCQSFREKVPDMERLLGPTGTFNTGTNLLYELLKENCVNPKIWAKYWSDSYGVLWQVPWGKQ